jgi:hypothetical protein
MATGSFRRRAVSVWIKLCATGTALAAAGACSPAAARGPNDSARVAADSIRLVAIARAALPADTGPGSMRVGYFRRDSAGTEVEFSPIPPADSIIVGGDVLVRVRPDESATVVRRSR